MANLTIEIELYESELKKFYQLGEKTGKQFATLEVLDIIYNSMLLQKDDHGRLLLSDLYDYINQNM